MEANLNKFEGWECCCCTHSNPSGYDSLVKNLREILRVYFLIGYHCTRLTREEIENIRVNGMAGQNAASLNARIDILLHRNLVNNEVAQCLRNSNQSNDSNRANMLWFCFFEPFLAGQSGIGRFFRSWGGEALYNSHEENPITSVALRKIGIPCIIKAHVPIASMTDSKFPDGAMVRMLLSRLGHRIRIPVEHEGYSTQNISVENIIEITEHPSARFNELTKCEEWDEYAI